MIQPPVTVRAWLDVDLDALRANALAFQAHVRVPMLPMVKSDAYGLGDEAVVRTLEPLEPWGYGVATLEEGERLRRMGITRPVVLFHPLLPDAARDALALDLRPTLGDLASLEAWLALGTAPFHLEIDTGLARAGLQWSDEALLAEAARRLGDAEGWEGAFTHFHSADDDPVATRTQWDRLHQALARLGRRPALVHAENSAASFSGVPPRGDLVRPGVYLFGGQIAGAPPARQVAALRARVVASRRLQAGDTVGYGRSWTAPAATTIVTLAIGYGDGVPLQLGNRGQVEIRDRLYPIVGRISMDLLTVDVADDLVEPGDVATLFGGQIPFESAAKAAGVVRSNLITAVQKRIPRWYHGR